MIKKFAEPNQYQIELADVLKEVKEISGATWPSITKQLSENKKTGAKIAADVLRQYAAQKKLVSKERLISIILAVKEMGWAGPKTLKILNVYNALGRGDAKQHIRDLKESTKKINEFKGRDKRAAKMALGQLEKAIRELMLYADAEIIHEIICESIIPKLVSQKEDDLRNAMLDASPMETFW